MAGVLLVVRRLLQFNKTVSLGICAMLNRSCNVFLPAVLHLSRQQCLSLATGCGMEYELNGGVAQ